MTLTEIKEAVSSGKKVYWKNQGYEVVKDKRNQFLVKCLVNNYCVGLTWADGVTTSYDTEDFFISERQKEIRYVVTTLKIQNGEYQYKSVSAVPTHAKSLWLVAHHWAMTFYQNFSHREGEDIYFNGGEVAVKVVSFIEITSAEYETLDKYL